VPTTLDEQSGGERGRERVVVELRRGEKTFGRRPQRQKGKRERKKRAERLESVPRSGRSQTKPLSCKRKGGGKRMSPNFV